MSVQIEPSEVLSFKRPLTRATKETLTIRNTSEQDIAFKVKTTAPKLYCVRPNSGKVPAYEELQVQVMLQPFKEEPPVGTKCKDKFLVQTVSLVGELKAMELQDIWPHVESNAKDLVEQIKLRCAFVDSQSSNEVYETDRSINESSIETTTVSKEIEEGEVITDELTRLRLELDAYKNEVEALRCRAPDAPTKKLDIDMKVNIPVAIIIAIVSFLLSYLLFGRS
ncbi:unnamed protein product [Cunninghamella echinulata]